jgi:hypothetical protein
MNIISLDPSILSTALCISTPSGDKLFSFFRDKKLSKWEKIISDVAEFKFTKFKDYKLMSYSEEQIEKHNDYEQIVEQIIDTILDNIDDTLETYIIVEGFSYSSSAGPLIDLVTFSTLLRDHLIKYVSSNITIVAPGELKKGCAMIVYDQGKDKAYRNNEIQPNGKGLAGGSFKKPQMALAMIDYYGKTGKVINKKMLDFLMSYKEDLFEMKSFPKPADDLIDSIWLCEVLKHKLAVLSA